MSIPVKVEMRESRPPEVSARRWSEIMRAAHQRQGEFWHKEQLPEHWKPYAKFRYQHKRRTKNWLKRKRREAARGLIESEAPRIDNLYEGVMRQALLERATIRAFPSRAKINLIGPRYISMRPYTSNQPDKWAELSRTDRADQQKLADVADESVAEDLKELDNRQPKVTQG